MTSLTPETGGASPRRRACPRWPPRCNRACRPGSWRSIEALASELTQDLQLRLEGDAATQIATAMSEIDMSDTKSILFFGTKAQQQLTSISDMMLEDVRTKDIGRPATPSTAWSRSCASSTSRTSTRATSRTGCSACSASRTRCSNTSTSTRACAIRSTRSRPSSSCTRPGCSPTSPSSTSCTTPTSTTSACSRCTSPRVAPS